MTGDKNHRWLLFVYAAAIFISAFLLFQVQPLITKRILPWFGGGPAVWTTCLLFFQTLLFAGYAYAHFSNWRLSPRKQAAVHVALIIAAVAMLGILPSHKWEPRGDENPLQLILMTLTVSVGLQYFVLSATGPLLQAWFARAFPSRSPYRLYALSNLGSLLALVSYPFIVEPLLPLPRQATIWAIGFLVFAVLCAATAWTRSRVSPTREFESRPAVSNVEPRDSSTCARPRPSQYVLWLILPAFASIVLMATTNHVSTDIAVMPFLWVAPLALYLLTFIIAFDRPKWYRPVIYAAFALITIYLTGLVHKNNVGTIKPSEFGIIGKLYFDYTKPTPPTPASPEPIFRISSLQFLAVNFAAMFGICMLCHGELVRQRPDPKYLTSFYLMIAAGGALGGAFVTLLAPRLFKTYLEWELSLFIAAIFAIGILLQRLVTSTFRDDADASLWRLCVFAPLILLPSAIALLDLTQFLQYPSEGIVFRERNFFGTLAVRERNPKDPLNHNFLMRHGVIAHGAQFTNPARRGKPITYFSRNSGIGRTMFALREQRPTGGLRFGIVGLGVGTLAAYAGQGDEITFYEINPAVVEIADNGPWFTYLKDCRARGAKCDIKLGDGRLTLQRELDGSRPHHAIGPDRSPPHRMIEQDRPPPHLGEGLGEGHSGSSPTSENSPSGNSFHLLALDAFSGDSVPVHLLTAEAFEVYLAHLDPDLSAIAVNISNRYVDLEPVMRGIADRFGLHWFRIHDRKSSSRGTYSSDWIILTRSESLFFRLNVFNLVQTKNPRPPILWTDTHSSLFDILK